MQVGETLAGKYRLMERLGEGGEGSVFLAVHVQTEMLWAIKEIRVSRDAQGRASCHELQMMKRLKNRHLPEIIDVILLDSRACLVMEYVRGTSLDRRLKGGRVLSGEEVQDVAEQVAEALCYLESRQPPVCHLDIKPSNLIRRPDGLIKLVDFGSAWKEKEQLKRMGTDGYAAPEQYRADAPEPDVRSDIYGLGATLYRMVCGKKWSPSMRMSSGWNCPPPMSELILRCLREDPAQRFQSAAMLREALFRIRKKERRLKGRRQILGAVAMALPAAALCLQILPAALDLSADESWDYDKLVREAAVAGEKEGMEYYRKAVFLEPGRCDAYLKFLSGAQMDGVFSDQEELFLRDTLHSVRPGTDMTYEELLELDPENYLRTALQIGLAYWYSCPREDAGKIAMGWFGKAVDTRGGTGKEMEDMKQKAQVYLRLGGILEKIHSSGEEEAPLNAARYWEDLGALLKRDDEDRIPEDWLTQLKFCRESLQTLTFLSGELKEAGISEQQQNGRIGALEKLARSVSAPAGGGQICDRILGEIEEAAASARQAATHNAGKE